MFSDKKSWCELNRASSPAKSKTFSFRSIRSIDEISTPSVLSSSPTPPIRQSLLWWRAFITAVLPTLLSPTTTILIWLLETGSSKKSLRNSKMLSVPLLRMWVGGNFSRFLVNQRFCSLVNRPSEGDNFSNLLWLIFRVSSEPKQPRVSGKLSSTFRSQCACLNFCNLEIVSGSFLILFPLRRKRCKLFKSPRRSDKRDRPHLTTHKLSRLVIE